MSPKPKPPGKTALRRGRSGVGSGWVAADGSGSINASILPEPVKRARGAAPTCSRCREELSPATCAALDDSGAVLGDACRRCWTAFACEFQRDASWHDVCARCREDKEYDEVFEMAAQVLAGERKSAHNPEEVKRSEGYELTVSRSFIGVPRADFMAAAGMTPSEAGYTEVDCPTETNATFKGVVLVNPLKPYVEFNLTYLKRIAKDEHVLPLDRSCRAGQGASTLKMGAGAQHNDRFITKLRNCALTVDQVAAETKCPEFAHKLLLGFAAGSAASGPGVLGTAAQASSAAASPGSLKRPPLLGFATPPAKKALSTVSETGSPAAPTIATTARSPSQGSIASRASFGGAMAPTEVAARPGMQQVNDAIPGKSLKDL